MDLNRISQRIHKDPLVEADYINYDYLETKSVPGQILDRSVTGTGHEKSRPVPALPKIFRSFSCVLDRIAQSQISNGLVRSYAKEMGHLR